VESFGWKAKAEREAGFSSPFQHLNFRFPILDFGLRNRKKMTRAKTQSEDSKQKAASSKTLKAINRRFTQMDKKETPLRVLPQRRRGRRELNFCLSGDDDKQNITQIRAVSFCPIVVSRLGKRDFLSVLCVSAVKTSESLSAKIGENLRLLTLCGLGVLARKLY